MRILDMKVGDTINWPCTYLVAGVPTALPATIASDIKNDDGTLVTALTVTQTDAPNGKFTLSADQSVSDSLAPSTLYCDIKFTDSASTVIHSHTFAIVVSEAIT